MAREKCLKKSFKDTLEDIKERMKEKRNQRLAKLGRYALGKSNTLLSAKGKIADDSSAWLKSFQANNRALALALEEEKSKMREAQDIILYLKREYQSLKFEMFVLERKLQLQQEKEHAETRLLMVKNVISKAVQNLLEATNLIEPAKDLCTTEFSQTLRVRALEECDSSHGGNQAAVTIVKPDFTITVNKQGKACSSEFEDNTDKDCSEFVFDSWQDVENIPTCLTPQTNKDWRYSSHEDCQPYENKTISSNENNKQVGNSLPKSVSTRRRYLRIQDQRELCASDGNNLEVTDQITESCEQDKTRPEGDLEMNNEQFEEMHPCAENTYDTSTDQSLARSCVLTESTSSTADLKETDFNSTGDSQTQKERGQKRKLEEVKKRSRTRSEKKSQSKHSCSKEKPDSSVGSSDAYDFIFEESVHITPFRQNKENENIMDKENENIMDKENENITDNKNCIEEMCSDSSSDEDSNDSLYIPYKNKSKSGKTLSHESDAIPVRTRRQSKKTVLEQHEKTTEGKMSIGKYESNASVTRKNSGSNAIMTIAEDVPCPVFTVEDKGKEHKMSSSENISFKIDKPSEDLQKCCHLGDITNLSSFSTRTRNSHPPIASGEEDSSHHRCRRIRSVSYREPALNRKLRRGDPFTDTGFLNSPIFKEKKTPKYKPVKKKFVSRYNEAFVGCL